MSSTITASVLESAREGIDEADRVPEITAQMIEAGVKALANVSGDIDATKDAALVTSIFTEMWNARKQ